MENRNDKLEAGEIRFRGGVLAKLDNFWYHYKWPTIFVIVATIIVLVCTLQFCQRKEYDFRYIYAGPAEISHEESEAICEALTALSTGGQFSSPRVGFNAYFLMTPAQIEEMNAALRPEGKEVNQALVNNNAEVFGDEVMAGEVFIFLLDPAWYESQKSAGFLDVRTFLPNAPDAALYDASALYLSKTVLGDVPAFDVLPEDTLVVIRYATSINIWDREQTLKYHERYQEVFKKLLGN